MNGESCWSRIRHSLYSQPCSELAIHRSLSYICAALLASGLVLGGCAEMQALQLEVTTLESKISVLEEKQASFEQSLDDLSKTSRKGLADTGADIDNIRLEIQEIRGLTDELNYQISGESTEGGPNLQEKFDKVERRLRAVEDFIGPELLEEERFLDPISSPSSDPLSPENAYHHAYALFKQEKYSSARDEFHRFLDLFPDNVYADNVQFWIGECYYREGDYKRAILEYNKVVKNYPKGEKVAGALLKQGFAFYNLKKEKEAILALEEVIKRYPKSDEAVLAKKKLEIITNK